MERRMIKPDLEQIPEAFHPLLKNTTVFDSSCSSAARVLFIDKDKGYYLKSAPGGSLKKEADMTCYFHSKALAPEVLAYESARQDWLLTRQAPGEDCTHGQYLAEPRRLCDTLAEHLRMLHELSSSGCPVENRTESYFATAERNYRGRLYDKSRFPDNWGYVSAEDAWQVVEANAHFLKNDVLLHGDYCLPNVMLDNWRFSGFIDLDNGGVGDRHIDLFWGMWSLAFNLKTDKYRERFLDAYGREKIESEMFRVIAAFEVFG